MGHHAPAVLCEKHQQLEFFRRQAYLHLSSNDASAVPIDREITDNDCGGSARPRLLGPAKALLAKLPGSTVVDLDAGCCGMAGSFGYSREHYDVSKAIWERKLLPAVRNRKPGAVVVAAGTSCRHQVKDFTGADALHPAVFLRSLLRANAR